MAHRLLLIPFLGLALVACASDEVPITGDDAGDNVRPEGPNGGGPAATDMGNGGEDDEDVDVIDDRDLGDCPETACLLADTRCEGLGFLTCINDDANPGCGTWGDFVECDGDEVCSDGACTEVMECTDGDGDGYGPQCAAGPDCDDSDAEINPDATEVCDGVDNDCDQEVDEGFDVGASCTVGSGNCQGDGVYECGPNGDVVCNAMASGGEPEVCDGIDNDCNGVVDDGGVCNFCTGDIYEPNDTAAEAEPLDLDAAKLGYLCPGDVDWWKPNVQPNTDYRLYVSFPEEHSAVSVEYYLDGQVTAPGDSGTDKEVIQFNGSDGTDFEFEVTNEGGAEQIFRIVLVDEWDCPNEDGFIPNQTISESSYFPRNWVTEAYMCAASPADWYILDEIPAGDRLQIFTEEMDFGMDLDLFLYVDETGNGSYTQIDSSATFSDIESFDHTVPTTARYIFEVRNYSGSGRYQMGWGVNL